MAKTAIFHFGDEFTLARKPKSCLGHQPCETSLLRLTQNATEGFDRGGFLRHPFMSLLSS